MRGARSGASSPQPAAFIGELSDEVPSLLAQEQRSSQAGGRCHGRDKAPDVPCSAALSCSHEEAASRGESDTTDLVAVV